MSVPVVNAVKKIEFENLPQDFTPITLPEILTLAKKINGDAVLIYERLNKPFFIETGRLIIRRFTTEDAEAVYELSNDRMNSSMRSFDHQWPSDMDGCRNATAYFADHDIFYAVCLKPSMKLIGFIAYNSVDDNGILDLGHVWHTAYQDNSLDTEALSLMTQYAFEKMGVNGVRIAEEYGNFDDQLLPSSARIPFSGAVHSHGPRLVPHTRAFASAMMSLTVLMGKPHNTSIINEHNMTFRADLDYYLHLLVSGEGFLFWQDVWNYFTHELPQGPGPDTWESLDVLPKNAEPVLDSFEIAGIAVALYSNYSINGIKGGWASDNMLKAMTLRNLAAGFPVLLFSGEPGDRILLAIGYQKSGDSLLAWTFSAGDDKQNKSFAPEKCKILDHWTDNIVAAAFVKSVPQTPADMKPLLCKALARGVEFLRHYGKIEAFRDTFNSAGKPHVHPEIWDLAERRAYLSSELANIAALFNTDQLVPAIDASRKIHDNMWRINALSKNKRGRTSLIDAAAQKQIVDILNECCQLDCSIADTISEFLGLDTPEGYSPKTNRNYCV